METEYGQMETLNFKKGYPYRSCVHCAVVRWFLQCRQSVDLVSLLSLCVHKQKGGIEDVHFLCMKIKVNRLIQIL